MTESRQQRRARQCSEMKARQRAATTAPSTIRVLDVEISRLVDPDGDDPDAVFWSGEWGLREADWGERDSYEDPTELVADVLDSARGYARRFPVHITWTLTGDAPAGQTVAEAITELGIYLPNQP